MACAPRFELTEARPIAPAGTSLLELVVVIAVLGVMAVIVGFSWRRAAPAGGEEASPAALVAAARRQALSSGTSVTVRVGEAGEARTVTALPDGRLLGGGALGFGALSGRPADSIAQSTIPLSAADSIGDSPTQGTAH